MRPKTKERIDWVNELIEKFGTMTLRQIYYQLVPKGLNYRKVMYVCKVGRLEGLIPWRAIVDRARPTYNVGKTFENIDDFLEDVADYFNLNYWDDSNNHIEIWTEKDALSQVLFKIAREYQVTVRVTRGFLSLSNKARWGAKNLTILYFGDFDPSGLYIDKDLQWSQIGYEKFKRIALTEEQLKKFDLPFIDVNRNDPRAGSYLREFGTKAWELDAMPPDELQSLVEETIKEYVDFDLQQKRERAEEMQDEIRSLVA